MLIYDSNKWQKIQYNLLRNSDIEVQNLIEKNNKYEQMGDFLGDIFSRCYSGDTIRKKENIEDYEIYEEAHNILSDMPDFNIMTEKTKNNPFFSELAVKSLGDEITKRMPEIKEPIKNISDLKNSNKKLSRYLDLLEKRLLNPESDDDLEKLNEEIQFIKKMVKKNKDNLSASKKAMNEANLKIDPSKLRSGIKKAISKAKGKMEDITSYVDAFFPGEEAGQFIKGDQSMIKKLHKLIPNNPKLKKVLKLAGKFESMFSTFQSEKMTDKNHEIIGVEKGNNLSWLMDSELSTLSASEDYFLMRYQKQELDQYELNTNKDEKGPVIFLLDNSGSMGGDRDIASKAILINLVKQCKKENRKFYCALFAYRIKKKWDYNDPFNDLISLISANPSGGTNFDNPLELALEKIKNEDRDADVIMITDGESSITEDIKNKIMKDDLKLFTFFIDGFCQDLNEISFKTIKSSETDEILKEIFQIL